MIATNKCPLCYFDLSAPPWLNGTASHEICPCCGTHFGYEDSCGGDEQARASWYIERRQKWIDSGMPWWSTSKPPEGWSGEQQILYLIAASH
ncbi:hypothetical protein ELE36_18245 [Pseudolysobacter antarcticus]|uniref:Uncharacterized protein n=1 Tax=Pseudolysobacter antarcticus TaxID=2511995 RepID=A0A411HNT1_9GAMM|nr:hypothetical protein ELE36_18245 [Pseudolysobacter antarcticus]